VDHDLTEEHKVRIEFWAPVGFTNTFISCQVWAEECGKMFGGLDILAIDVLHTKSGRGVILEVRRVLDYLASVALLTNLQIR
jgi:Synapsin, ATP binding domain